MLCQSPFKVAGSKFERPSKLVSVSIVDISAPVRISVVKAVHQLQETESQIEMEPRLMREWSKRKKAFVQTSRGEQTSSPLLDLKECSSYAERAHELIATLLNVPPEASYIALLSLAKPRKPFVLQTVASAVLKVDDFYKEQQTIREEDVVTLLQNKVVELIVGHVIICTGF